MICQIIDKEKKLKTSFFKDYLRYLGILLFHYYWYFVSINVIIIACASPFFSIIRKLHMLLRWNFPTIIDINLLRLLFVHYCNFSFNYTQLYSHLSSEFRNPVARFIGNIRRGNVLLFMRISVIYQKTILWKKGYTIYSHLRIFTSLLNIYYCWWRPPQ